MADVEAFDQNAFNDRENRFVDASYQQLGKSGVPSSFVRHLKTRSVVLPVQSNQNIVRSAAQSAVTVPPPH